MATYFPLRSLTLLTSLAGCGGSTMHLLVPQGVTGRVIVDCDSNDDQGGTVRVDAQGHGRAHACPRNEARVFVDRNGSSTRIENVEWLKTGDGLTTQFRLDLH